LEALKSFYLESASKTFKIQNYSIPFDQTSFRQLLEQNSSELRALYSSNSNFMKKL
jgi:hypothetical protein